MSFQMRIGFDEFSKAESLVILDDHPAHALHPRDIIRTPFAKLGGRRVASCQSLDDCIGGDLSAAERKQYAGGIKRIEEPKRIADEDPAVAGALFGPVAV